MSDFEVYARRPYAEFDTEVRANMAAAAVDTDQLELRAGEALANIRLQGGFLTSLVLQGEAGAAPIELLYRDANLSLPKLPASHAMIPVGPSKGPGGQHGFVRWVRHDVAGLSQTEQSATAHLVPRGGEGLPFVSHSITLENNRAKLGLSVTNMPNSNNDLALSLGEHFYFRAHGLAQEIIINGQTIDELLGPGAAAEVDGGNAQFWPGFDGTADVDLPNGLSLRIEAAAKGQGGAGMRVGGGLGMLLWRRQGDDAFVCLEPTLGLGIDRSNDNVVLRPGAMAMLQTVISLRS